MRSLVRSVGRYVAEVWRSTTTAWDAFWFAPADPALLGVIRVLAGLMLLYTHGVWGLALEDFFGERAWLDGRLVGVLQQGQPTLSFWWLVPSGSELAAWWASMAVLTLFTIGLWTRVTSWLSLAVAISFAHRTPEAQFGLDQINVMLALYLSIGDGGRAVSVDRWLANRRGAESSMPTSRVNLGLRLIQVHMCVIYFFAGVSKLQGPSWWNGEAMWRAFANLEYQTTDMTWLASYPLALNVMTHMTIVWELTFAALIWKPLWRPIMLACGIAMHLGIGACLGMWTFGLIMLVGCASFLPPTAARGLVDGLASSWSRRWTASRVPVPATISASLPTSLSMRVDGPESLAGRAPRVVLAVDYGVSRRGA